MKQIKFVVGLFFLVVTTGGAFAAPTFEKPEALLDYAYKPYSTEDFPDDPFELFSAGLHALVEADAARTPVGEMGTIDFDPFINAQDYAGIAMRIDHIQTEGDQALVDVSVENFGQRQALVFSLVNEAGSWRIDDIESRTPEFAWRLSTLLTEN